MNPVSCAVRGWLRHLFLALVLTSPLLSVEIHSATTSDSSERRLLYVAVPGIRDYLEFGGHGVLVFDIDHGHKFIKRIPARGLDEKGKPLNVKGICASAATGRFYVSTLRFLTCFDLGTGAILWEKAYPGGCDRMAISPDGKIIYLPSLEKEHWHVIDAMTGEVIKKLVPNSGAHNTLYSLDGSHAYLAGLKSPLLRVTDTGAHEITREIGPFSNSIRPFTVNGRSTLCFVNVNELLGFEIGDLQTGKVLRQVKVEGFGKGPVKRHGCPSHGIGLTPDESELWLSDGANQKMHIFDIRELASNPNASPKQIASLPLREQPGWVTFTLKGDYGYPSTGEVIDVKTHPIIATLADENGVPVHSEKMVEIDFKGDSPLRTGDQFGIGRVR